MEIDIYIDVMTNCLVLAETGEECDTEYQLVVKRITKWDAKGLFLQPLYTYIIPHFARKNKAGIFGGRLL